MPNTNLLNFSNSEEFTENEKFKKVLIIPFENTFNLAIGLLPEHRVLEIEKSNSEENDQNIKSYEIVKKKEKPLHSVSHEGSIGKSYYYFIDTFQCYKNNNYNKSVCINGIEVSQMKTYYLIYLLFTIC